MTFRTIVAADGTCLSFLLSPGGRNRPNTFAADGRPGAGRRVGANVPGEGEAGWENQDLRPYRPASCHGGSGPLCRQESAGRGHGTGLGFFLGDFLQVRLQARLVLLQAPAIAVACSWAAFVSASASPAWSYTAFAWAFAAFACESRLV